MEECSSLRSSDSAGTSEEYEILESLAVHTSEPQLNIANDGNMEDLKQELKEVMREKGSESSSPNCMDLHKILHKGRGGCFMLFPADAGNSGLTFPPLVRILVVAKMEGWTIEILEKIIQVFSRWLQMMIVARVLITFAAAFRRVPRSKLVKKEEELCQSRQVADCIHLFDISLEIKEEDSKGNFNTVPRDKEFFKLRSNTEKQLVLTVTAAPPSTQSSSGTSNVDELCVERCFGLLVALVFLFVVHCSDINISYASVYCT